MIITSPSEDVAVVCFFPFFPPSPLQCHRSATQPPPSSSDHVPPAVRLIHETQRHHARLASELESELAYAAEALALKSNLLYSDLPKFPTNVMIHFNPPLIHRPGYLCLTYDLGVGPPPPKTLAIQLLHTAVEFAALLNPYAMDVYHESGIVFRALVAADGPHGLGRTPVWAPSEAVMAAIRKWSNRQEREDELEKWVAATARVVERLQEVVAGADTPVLEIAAAGWRGGAYASGVVDPGTLLRRRVVRIGRGYVE